MRMVYDIRRTHKMPYTKHLMIAKFSIYYNLFINIIFINNMFGHVGCA